MTSRLLADLLGRASHNCVGADGIFNCRCCGNMCSAERWHDMHVQHERMHATCVHRERDCIYYGDVPCMASHAGFGICSLHASRALLLNEPCSMGCQHVFGMGVIVLDCGCARRNTPLKQSHHHRKAPIESTVVERVMADLAYHAGLLHTRLWIISLEDKSRRVDKQFMHV